MLALFAIAILYVEYGCTTVLLHTDNSNQSRFGKLIKIFFERNTGKLRGAAIESYLLEKVISMSQQIKMIYIQLIVLSLASCDSFG
jgi:hypothetical protein